MLRSIYRYLVSCHPAPFRRRFGDEMSSIFDCVPCWRTRIALIADAFISLLRQWTVREPESIRVTSVERRRSMRLSEYQSSPRSQSHSSGAEPAR